METSDIEAAVINSINQACDWAGVTTGAFRQSLFAFHGNAVAVRDLGGITQPGGTS
jgi:hypothetical protein